MEPNMEPNVQNQQAPSPEPNPQSNPQLTPEQQAKQKRKNRWLTALIIFIGVLVFLGCGVLAYYNNFVNTPQKKIVDQVVKQAKDGAKEGYTAQDMTAAVCFFAEHYSDLHDPEFYKDEEQVIYTMVHASILEQGYKGNTNEVARCGEKLGKNAMNAVKGVYLGKHSVSDEKTQEYLAEVKDCIFLLNQYGVDVQLQ